MRSSSERLANGNSRRRFLQVSAAASAAMAMRVMTEPMLAAEAAQRDKSFHPTSGVMINANENPLGPCDGARSAISEIAARGGRYSDWLTDDLAKFFAEPQGLKADYVKVFPGSSGPLHFAVLSFTSAKRSYVTADPGYEAGMRAAEMAGARVVKVPLTKSFAHDVKAMVAAAPDAGLFYVCTPNNPTGTLTPLADIEWLVANKPKGSVVLVDEAYIHFAGVPSALDLVKSGQDVIVLRTFSKIYGMAGIRCGFAIARPELNTPVGDRSGYSAMPVTAVAAASASLKDAQLVVARKQINTTTRQATFDWLSRQGYSYVPSESNCFMADAKRPAKQVIEAMGKQQVYIGRPWPVWPTHVRITVGTQDEMLAFQAAYQKVMTNAVTTGYTPPVRLPRGEDGQVWPSKDGSYS
jgi:histidinol-phosphate aminotransferase